MLQFIFRKMASRGQLQAAKSSRAKMVISTHTAMTSNMPTIASGQLTPPATPKGLQSITVITQSE